MQTAYRDPDTLTITVCRHPHRAETSIEITHEANGLTVVIWDDWAPGPEKALGDFTAVVVDVWVRTGPLAAAAAAAGLAKAARPRRRR